VFEDFGCEGDEREARRLEGGFLGGDCGVKGVEGGGDFRDRAV